MSHANVTMQVLQPGNANDLETRFCWHGFQYVLVTPSGNSGFAGGIDDIVGLAIHTNMTETGSLLFSGDGVEGSPQTRAAAVLSGIYHMTLQSQRTNVAAYIPTDCPTRGGYPRDRPRISQFMCVTALRRFIQHF